ncbi:hypothetical protein ACWCQR_10930, partial [Streptomyces sp. NPDC002172]
MYLKSSPATSDLDEAVSAFVQYRARLFGIAYRVLGSVAEAEDVVQAMPPKHGGPPRYMRACRVRGMRKTNVPRRCSG